MTIFLFLACLATALYLGIILGRRIEVANHRIDGLIARHEREVAVNDEADMGEVR